ncbi:hypothetical protein OD91_0593 [Lutibacter sp. Hel_I_33_5]|uniref:hypothetical protein n=1 Tax=Lutibacter sp. Hel_I_33_5 TaxID=1566289 RepID=UPI00119D245C|nr:hypothetical protein [Lutibacter sp. Hel_I_33_5]TVZ55347.1 hypothetical protein OD91_0593 [Lutibacter sp. Hel_I_33_5]
MKNLLVLFLFLLSINNFSQERGIIHLRDGSKLIGSIEVKPNGKIKYRKDKNSKKEILDHKRVKKLRFFNGGNYEYKILNNSIILARIGLIGKLNLYYYLKDSPGMYLPLYSNGVLSVGVELFKGKEKKGYYIGRKNEDLIENLFSNPKRGKFFSVISKYTSDCPEFIKLIKNKSVIKKKFDSDVVQIIRYYNQNCK